MVLRVLARPLLASWFVYEAAEAILTPQKRAEQIAPVVEPALADLGVTEVKTVDIVKAQGFAVLGAAASLALSRNPRTSALALVALTAGSISLTRPFWNEKDPEARREQFEHFLKDIAITGGLLIAATAGHSDRHNKRAKAKKVKAKERAHARKHSA